jgi:DNA polymerase-1
MSVTDPALQTLPHRKAGPLVRDAFVPRPGNLLVLADYDTQELRIMAHLSGDEQMIADFLEGRDLHMETALGAYGLSAGKPERTVCKNANYARVYGGGIGTVADTAGIDDRSAASIFGAFDRRYPGAAQLMASVTAAVRDRAKSAGSEYGYVTLGDSRRLRVSSDKAYVGINWRIQGQGAVEMKRSLVNLDAAGLGPFLLLPVHDEVVLDVPEADVEDAIPTIRAAMERHEYRVPLTVGTKAVDRWGTAYREDG